MSDRKQAIQDVIDLENKTKDLELNVVKNLSKVYQKFIDSLVDNVDKFIDRKSFTLKISYANDDILRNSTAEEASLLLQNYLNNVTKITVATSTLNLFRDINLKNKKKVKKVGKVVGLEELPTSVTPKKISKVVVKNATINKTKVDYINTLAKKEIGDIEEIIQLKLVEAIKTNPNIKISSLREIVSKHGEEFTHQRLVTIARTEKTNAVNEAIVQTYKDVNKVRGYWFIAIWDKKTSKYCNARTDVRIPKDYPKLKEQFTPAIHVNCRSILSPIYTSDTKPLTSTQVLDSIALKFPCQKKGGKGGSKSKRGKK